MDRYEALKLAVREHGTDTDKCGTLYVLHPIAVAEAIERSWDQVQGTNSFGVLSNGASYESAAVVALLHDVEEDTDYKFKREDFTPDQWTALMLLTRRPHDEYASYIAKIVVAARSKKYDAGRLAALVKLADLWHNLHPSRQGCLPSKEQRSLETRYLKSRDALWNVLGYEWWPEEVTT